MQPQGEIFNTAHIDALVDRINAAQQCDQLQDMVDDVMGTIQAQLDAIGEQLQALQPLLDLLKLPTTLQEIIAWIKKFATAMVAPYVAAYYKLVAQLAAVIAAIAKLEAAIQKAASRLTTCSISVPPLTKPPLPQLPDLKDL